MSRDEWILLLDLYLRHRPAPVALHDPDLIELSATLSAAVPGSQQAVDHWRSPDGLRARLSVFRVLDPLAETRDTKRAAIATAIWNELAHDPAGCAAEATLARRRLLTTMRPVNPDWTWEETLLALDTYLRIRPKYASAGDGAIEDLSEILRIYARQRGAAGAASFRNPAGVARKINKFRAAEAGEDARAVRGAQLEGTIWRAFVESPGELLQRAVALRSEIGAEQSSAAPGPPVPLPSRGPAPSLGVFANVREDGENFVYVMCLAGPVHHLFPEESARGQAVIKVGRANDVARRCMQFNVGFPPRCGLAWRVVDQLKFPSALAAHNAERELLARLYAAKLTLGGEFALTPSNRLFAWLRELGTATKTGLFAKND